MSDGQIQRDQQAAVADSSLSAVIAAAVESGLAKINERGFVPVQHRWLRTPAAARYLGYDEATLVQMRAQKRGPSFRRCGSRVLYDVRDLDAFVELHPLVEAGQQS